MSREGIAECPRCHKVWRLPWGSPGVECTCHLYCSGGTQPSDCTVTYPYNYTGELKWPIGMHNDSKNEGDNIWKRSGYCSTHSKYTNKEPIWLEVNWEWFEKTRLPKNLRLMNQ